MVDKDTPKPCRKDSFHPLRSLQIEEESGWPGQVKLYLKLYTLWSSLQITLKLGKDAARDVTVINPLQAATVSQAADTPGHALQVAHQRKLDKSWQPCHNQGIVFLPLAVESLGAWHKAAITEVKKLGSSLARHTGEEEATTIKHLFQQLSLALVKGNAALLNNRNPGGAADADEGAGW